MIKFGTNASSGGSWLKAQVCIRALPTRRGDVSLL